MIEYHYEIRPNGMTLLLLIMFGLRLSREYTLLDFSKLTFKVSWGTRN